MTALIILISLVATFFMLAVLKAFTRDARRRSTRLEISSHEGGNLIVLEHQERPDRAA